MGSTIAHELQLSISDGDDEVDELYDLYEMLRDDDELVGVRTSLVNTPAPEGAMGAEEIVRIIFDNPALWGAVTASVTAWLATRKARSFKVVLRANKSVEIHVNGVKEITSADVAAALRIARELEPGETSRS